MRITIYSKPHNLPIVVDEVSGAWEPPMFLIVLDNISGKLGRIHIGEIYSIEHEGIKRKFRVASIYKQNTQDEIVNFEYVP